MRRALKGLGAAAVSLLALASAGAQSPGIDLWPGVAPGSERWSYVERSVEDAPGGAIVVNVVKPTLTAYLPDPGKATGTGVIIAPGGAYAALLIEQEGRAVARWLQARGIAAFVLKYRLMEQPAGGGMPSMPQMSAAEPFAVADGLQAMKVLRERAAEWGVAPARIGIVGFSAGATVAAAALLGADAAARPDFAGIIYGGPFGGPASVPGTLPPVFLAWAQDDPIGENTTARLYAALKAAGHKPEAHAYAAGGHGFGMRQQGLPSDHWIEAFHHWLQSQGFARPPAPEAQLSGGRPDLAAPPPAKKLYEQRCAICHTDAGIEINGRIIPTTATLRAMQASKLYESMAHGKMMPQSANISDRDMRGIAELVTGKKMEGSADTLIAGMRNNCPDNPPLPDPADSPAWNGWSPAPDNARHQGAAAARLTAADVPRLRLKWAFGLPLGASTASQPSVVAGRVFVGSDNATLYALDARSGCAYWSYRTRAPGRAAPIVAPIKGHEHVRYAVYYATADKIVHALDAHSGQLLWERAIPGEGNGLTGSPAYYAGRLYVPLTASGVTAGFTPHIECCKSRGAVVALDAADGTILWRSETVPEPLEKLSLNSAGTQVWGPAGASVWNTPTIDAKRGLIYVGTGNSYGPKVASTSDSILALRMQDGAIQWHHQEFRDAFMLGCPDRGPPGQICPEEIGPDWDFGGASAILQPLGKGRDVLVAAGKGGIAIALDPDRQGRLLWRTKLYDTTPPTADGLVLFGGTADGRRVYFPLQQEGGGLKALDLATGRIEWDAPIKADKRGQASAASSLPGVVFTGGWDGIVRAVDMSGRVIWSFDTRQRFDSVNGVIAIGGSIGAPGPTIADGMVYVASGYPGFQNGTPGNVILAFGLD